MPETKGSMKPGVDTFVRSILGSRGPIGSNDLNRRPSDISSSVALFSRGCIGHVGNVRKTIRVDQSIICK